MKKLPNKKWGLGFGKKGYTKPSKPSGSAAPKDFQIPTHTKDMETRDMFLSLASATSPSGTEHIFEDMLLEMGMEYNEWGWGVDIGISTTIFTAHLDTADFATEPMLTSIEVNAAGVASTKTNTLLGGDNRAGVTVLLQLIRHKVPGRYLLFFSEEAGRIGSELYVASTKGLDAFERVISFDRNGNDEIITHQMGRKTASNSFADALATELLPYFPLSFVASPNGSYTDSYSFADFVSECTNVSIGYENAHTAAEKQDLVHLESMVTAALSIDWDSLPADRKPEPDTWMYDYGYSSYYSVEKYTSGRDSRYDYRYATMSAEEMKYLLLYENVDDGDLFDWVLDNPDEAVDLIRSLSNGKIMPY